ncbi:serine/threonine protein kinase [Anaerosphaera aminiphila DSM 21120]|uniref:non-specific serine/threonine protein kinase n=1 Tax=Anaerosphaera aminiphila DSM 21120 TaxID=1120995 RepID=A0A1M5T0W1_9FIRM|nr:Stk1 family PASTA domain-containing Ser/Thr kinase [Anaerosphaera aminiphila]SHH44268.1 serine/threonine protein kinase [Anaerosphaera aminiphila DSM 21120]
MIGKVLGNRYEVLEKIGAGGMGDVYKAHDRKLDRIVAVKILKAEYTDDSNFIRKFKRESLAAASISHPNIVSIYDVGSEEIESQKVHYIVMEFIDGKTLKEIINEEGRLNEKRALNYTVQVAEALKTAHSKGIVHRDIKTQNIMVTKDDRVKVTDFGIARVADNSTVTATNAIMGSVHYFSPEQARGAKVDNRSDIYSLGIVLYEMLTGKLPFDAENPVSVALMQVQSDMPLPSKSYSDISSDVDGIVLKLTMKNPEDRYPDVNALIKDIKNVQLGKTAGSSYTKTSSQETVVMSDPRIQNSSNGRSKKVIRRDDDTSDNVEQKKPKKKKKKGSSLPIILGIISAVLIFFLLAFVVPKVFNNKADEDAVEKVSVPSLVGTTKAEAKAKLDALGLVFEQVGVDENENKNDEEIISQEPKEGIEVEKGSTVKVVVNVLPEAVNMPKLVGETLESAQKIASENGLKITNIKNEFDDEVEEGKIISQDPEAGNKVSKNKEITITVSKGIEVKKEIEVPNTTGLDKDEAKSALEGKDFVVKIKEEYNNKVDPGQVADYEPKGTVEEGSTITLIINSGKPDSGDLESDSEEVSKGRNFNVRVPEDDERHQVLVKRTLTNGSTIDFYNYKKSAEDNPIEIPIEGAHKGEKFELYVDGILQDTQTIN